MIAGNVIGLGKHRYPMRRFILKSSPHFYLQKLKIENLY